MSPISQVCDLRLMEKIIKILIIMKKKIVIIIIALLTLSLIVGSCSRGKRVGAVCEDGWRSSATGRGACSHHDGVDHWIYEND